MLMELMALVYCRNECNEGIDDNDDNIYNGNNARAILVLRVASYDSANTGNNNNHRSGAKWACRVCLWCDERFGFQSSARFENAPSNIKGVCILSLGFVIALFVSLSLVGRARMPLHSFP